MMYGANLTIYQQMTRNFSNVSLLFISGFMYL